jgi:cell surface protein SprA
MKDLKNYFKLFFVIILFSTNYVYSQEDSLDVPYPLKPNQESKLYLKNPVQEEAVFDIETGKYIIYQKVGTTIVGNPTYMTPDEYTKHLAKQKRDAYYREKLKSLEQNNKNKKSNQDGDFKNLLPSVTVKSKLFETIFGGNKIEFIPQGFASIDLGILYQKIDNPTLPPTNRQNFTIDLQQRIQLSLLGKVGNNLQLKANYDTQAGFAFENRMNLKWKPADLLNAPTLPRGVKQGEDRIIRNIEFGNVNLPLSTSLITGAQSLFGVKTDLQFGKTAVTAVFSEQQSEARNITVQNGGMVNTFKINVTDYEDNQHYFLAQHFEKNYDNWLQNYPLVTSKMNIIRMEVWKIDVGNANLQNQRSLIGVRDLGESTTNGVFPDNEQQNLYTTISNIRTTATGNFATIESQLQTLNSTITPTDPIYRNGEHFVTNRKVRKLNQNEYFFNPELGYISLNQRLTDDQLLAVSFQYTRNDAQGKVFKVGEFSEESNGVVIAKLLKPNNAVSVSSPMWELMMKNVYQLPASQVSKENFFLNVYFRDDSGAKANYLDGFSNNQPLIRVLNWDRLNLNGDNSAAQGGLGDGIFDFVNNLTIFPERGKIIHTKTKPYFTNLPSNYSFQDLYTKLKGEAINNRLSSRYTLEGRYTGQTGDGIRLGAFNVPRGSVRVTANGQPLTEGVDYTVDYQIGEVKILNQTLKDSGVPINVSLENQSTFNVQRKRFWGINAEHKFNDKFLLGATFLNYKERPLTQKANYGVEAVNNSILGMNLQYQTEAPFLTRLTDKIPGIQTNAPSNISLKMETAYLIPGINSATNNESYIDDFEETSAKINLKDPNNWVLASKPANLSNGNLTDNQRYGDGRALASWYFVDPRFYGVGGNIQGITNDAVSKHSVRRVGVKEIFNRRDLVAGELQFMNVLDYTVYPKLRGPYNVNPDFANETPQSRWSGMMRPINVTNFVQANVEYVEFWMMDPYADGNTLGINPKLKIHLGNVSEDILKDGKQQYENGLPHAGNPILETTDSNWGNQPKNPAIVYTFDSDGANRTQQDKGFDGILSNEEVQKFGTFSDNPNDAAADDFKFFLDASLQNENDVAGRYRFFRNPEGNSPAGSLNASSQTPDVEDLNNDFNLDTAENFNEYEIPLNQAEIMLGKNNIVDVKEVDITFRNGNLGKSKWFLYRIPVKNYTSGKDEILNNVRFMRIITEGFENTSTLRFATLDLVRADWRRYNRDIFPQTSEGTSIVNNSNLEIGSVNVEENSIGKPPYLLPPGIIREELAGTGGVQSQNEASLALKVRNLTNDARGVFKYVNLDMRRYKKLKLFVSAQDLDNITSNAYDENSKFFIRVGSDLSDNYYEYEISLKYTSQNDNSATKIWAAENTIDLNIEELVKAKSLRDKNSFPSSDRFEYVIENLHKKIIVKGRPSVGNVTSIMMGVRNTNSTPKNLILWVNELRLGEIENADGGFATNTNLAFNLADFAQFNTTAQMSTVGFGALDSNPNQRSQDDTKQYNIAANVNVDKLLPKKVGLRIPVTVSYGEKFVDPKYNPVDNDVEFKNAPNKERLKEVVRSYSEVKTIGINGLQKERTTDKPQKFYDVENLTASFLYSDTYFRDIYTAHNITQNLNASLDYNFNFKPWSFQPLKTNKFFNRTSSLKYLQFIKEFNINPVPSRISFRTEARRVYNQFEFRDINSLINGTEPTAQTPIFTNNFLFGWQYNVGFNLTKSLKLDYNSNTQTLVDHLNPSGTPNDKLIWNDLISAGRPVLYNHKLQANYRLPLNYFPFLDFINADLSYSGAYNWQARSTILTQGVNNLGNIAQNNNTKNLTVNLDFGKIFNKFKIYKKIDSIRTGRHRQLDSIAKVYEENYEKGKPNQSFTSKYRYKLKHYPLLLLQSFKRAQLTLTENNGTILPGYLAQPDFFGQGVLNGTRVGPTTAFLFGSQFDIRRQAIENGWITNSDFMNEPFARVKNQQLTGTTQIEPSKHLRINLNVARNYQENLNQFQYNINPNAFENITATHNISVISLPTSFSKPEEIYSSLLTNSRAISRRLGTTFIDANNDGYNDGYGLTNADVLIPSFFTAYTGQDANSTNLSYKKAIPLPNWQITYTGLNAIPFINQRFQKIDVTHNYVSTYTVQGVQSNLNQYNSTLPSTTILPDDAHLKDKNGNYYSKNIFGSISMVEGFSPLVGVDVTMRNSMQLRFQYNKDRLTTLSLSNFTLNEELSNELVFGLGYIVKDLKLNFRFKGDVREIKSDLNVRFDLSIRDTETRLRRIIENDNQIVGGQKLVSIRFSTDYNFSRNLNLKLFYDQNLTSYKISTAFPLSVIRAGLSATLRFGN